MGDSTDDLDLLVELLEDCDEPQPVDNRPNEARTINSELSSAREKKSNSSPKVSNQSMNSKGHSSTIDPLELELREMEEKMNKLKQQLSKKKNLTDTDLKQSFTKYTPAGLQQSTETVRQLTKVEEKSLMKKLGIKKSAIHGGETDSEDEEDNRNPMETNFSTLGRDIRKRLAHSDEKSILSQRTNVNPFGSNSSNDGWKEAKGGSLLPMGHKPNKAVEDKNPGIADPFSGIKIINPKVSASTMNDLMGGRRMVQISSFKNHLQGGEIEGDWVTIGIVAAKSDPKKSQKGSQYSIWSITDLRDCTIVVSLFLFSDAYKHLWKNAVGTVIGILNPQIMKDREDDKRNALSLSVNSHHKVLIMGISKDLGWCKGRTLAKGQCRNFVNKSVCEFCIYHIQSEYKKTSAKRSEIQSSFTRVDPRKKLQNKILGNNTVFYGGQLYGSIPSSLKESSLVKSKKAPANRTKDLATLSSLTVKLKANEIREEDMKNSTILRNLSDAEVASVQKVTQENEKLGQRLLLPSPGARNLLLHKTKESSPAPSKTPVKDVSGKSTARGLLDETRKQKKMALSQAKPPSESSGSFDEMLNLARIPQLGRGLGPGKGVELDLSAADATRKKMMAKIRAANLLKSKGGIESPDRNMKRNRDKASSSGFQKNVKKRLKEEEEIQAEEDETPETKKARTESEILTKKKSLLGSIDLNSEKFKSLMEVKSKHTNLIKVAEDEEVEKYYNNLEKKEMIENKMASIMEVPTKAVICLQCKYKSSSAAEHCRTEQHTLRVVQAVRRFFECRNCKRRAASLDKLPTKACSNCDQNSWKRVAMGKEKTGPKLECEILSLRGDEINHYGGLATKSYLNI